MRLILNKDGSILYHSDQTGETSPILKVDGILQTLGLAIELEKGYTIRSLFMMLQVYTILRSIVPVGWIEPYMEEYDKQPKNGCVNDSFTHIYINDFINIEVYSDEAGGEVLDKFVRVSGFDEEDPDGMRYALDYMGIKQLLDLPIVLDEIKMYLHDFTEEDNNVLATYEASYTMFDYVHGLIFELSYHGSPAETKQRQQESDTEEKKERKKGFSVIQGGKQEN